MSETENNAEAPSKPEAKSEAQAVQSEAQAKSVTLTYMPLPGDPEQTTVAGVKFNAYEPVTLTRGQVWLADKLAANSWFSSGPIDEKRKAAWKAAQEARAKADALRNQADAAEREARSVKF